MKIRLLLILIAFLCIYSPSICAQSKPKRDTSKDRSVIVAKQKEKARKIVAASVEKRRKETVKRYRRLKPDSTPIVASYLRVNQLPYINKNVSSYGGGDLYKVNTDGKEWSVVALPAWCHLTKYSDSFLISYDQNMSHDDRSDWFKVTSGGFEVRINITQSGAPLNISAKFNNCSLQHNYFHYNRYGIRDDCLKIDANVTIKGAKDQKCLIVAFISDDKNNSIKAAYNYSDFAITSSKDVFAATEVVPTTDNAQTYNLVLYLPNNAMDLPKKKNTLRCQLVVYCVKNSSFINDAKYIMYFKAKKKRGKVTTQKL